MHAMRRHMLLPVLLLAGILSLAGCGSDEEQDEAREATTAVTDTTGAAETLDEVLDEAEEALDDALTLELEEQNGSGVGGTVKLSPDTDGTVNVTIDLTGDDGTAHPAHIHLGSCDDLDPTPKWPLEDVVEGKSETTVDVSLSDLEAEEYAVNVHESAENSDTYIACADLHNQ
jgi:ABC-type glycerol-3-phosphate transport system substrate-binding protein